MALAKKIKRIAFICLCNLVGSLSCQASETGKVFLEHLNNGMTFCLSHQEMSEDVLSIDLIVKFDNCWQTREEKILSKMIENLVVDALKDFQLEIKNNHQIDLFLEEPKAFDYPNIVLYKMKLMTPTQKRLEITLQSVSETLDLINEVSFDEIELKLKHELLQREITPIQVKNFSDYYYKKENMVLFLAGNLAHMNVSDSVKGIFSSASLIKPQSRFHFANVNYKDLKLSFVDYVQAPDSNRWLVSPYKIDPPEFKTFDDIILEEKEEMMIEKLMRSLASSSVPKLIWKQNELQKIGRSINHIHPLKFISHIINQPVLRSDLQEIHRNYFKWRGFLDGFRKRMTEEFYKGSLKDLIPGFANSVDAKQEIIEHFIEKRDWEGLVKAILY